MPSLYNYPTGDPAGNPPDVDAPRYVDWATGRRPTVCESCGGADGDHAGDCPDAPPDETED